MKTVVVIGGGPAGMMASVMASKNNKVILIEKNEKLGKKLYLTGKGRCNLTNDCLPDEFFENVVSNKRFLYSAINQYSPQEIIDFFESNGLRLKVERGNRVFPSSDKASDVTKILNKILLDNGVQISLNEEVKNIHTSDGKVTSVETSLRTVLCDAVVLATGGKSYPKTGSDGKGYHLASTLGHDVITPVPALVGLELFGDFYKKLQGLSLKNVKLTVKHLNKTLYSEVGEMLFTHFGISGPLVLTTSSIINRLNLKEVEIYLDLKPGLNETQLLNRIERDFVELKGKNLANSLVKLMPSRLIGIILEYSKLSAELKPFSLSKAQKDSLVDAIKNFKIKIKSLRPLDEAIVTSGGIKVNEINPKTMESKIVKSLFFAGEVIDVDAFTGGFNIQIALATGAVAGQSI